MKKIALITGATSGIGKATAERLAENGFDIIITGRRKEKLQELEDVLKKEYNADVLSLEFDVRNYAEVEKYLGSLPERWKRVDVLVNNAGLAVGLNSIQEGVVDDWERMVDTNVKGLLYVTRIISPGMVERRSGHIINIGSIASREVYANGGVYCATKHAVKALSQGMRLDMVDYGVKVTLVCPGAVETEFSVVRFKGDQTRADKVYDGFVPLAAEDVADAIYYAVSAPDHVDVQDVLLMAKAQASATVFHKE
uniref:SDR family NAD(P)-dependent oxidoreductase n=1 Tax=uncultured Dysgonomonas sp. TaxID=206096 RepID=UPI002609AC32|nr:SDR family NAD(P)-dependent oxidoreductase [uncultured Dysgonomonas sp.]